MIQKYKVTRQILFDRLYQAGETYEGNASEVAHLVANGVLVPIKAKADAAPANKADQPPKNKAA